MSTDHDLNSKESKHHSLTDFQLRSADFINVPNKNVTSKSENTCKCCGNTFLDFLTLLNHSCLPYRCKVCSMTFSFDYMLKMHKCDTPQSNSKNSGKIHCCQICESSFSDLNLLLTHQFHCKRKKHGRFNGELPKIQSDFFSRNKDFLKRKAYSLRCKSSDNFKSTLQSFEDPCSEFKNSEIDNADTDHNHSSLNMKINNKNPELLNTKRKRYSLDKNSNERKRTRCISENDRMSDSNLPLDPSSSNSDLSEKFENTPSFPREKNKKSNLSPSLLRYTLGRNSLLGDIDLVGKLGSLSDASYIDRNSREIVENKRKNLVPANNSSLLQNYVQCNNIESDSSDVLPTLSGKNSKKNLIKSKTNYIQTQSNIYTISSSNETKTSFVENTIKNSDMSVPLKHVKRGKLKKIKCECCEPKSVENSKKNYVKSNIDENLSSNKTEISNCTDATDISGITVPSKNVKKRKLSKKNFEASSAENSESLIKEKDLEKSLNKKLSNVTKTFCNGDVLEKSDVSVPSKNIKKHSTSACNISDKTVPSRNEKKGITTKKFFAANSVGNSGSLTKVKDAEGSLDKKLSNETKTFYSEDPLEKSGVSVSSKNLKRGETKKITKKSLQINSVKNSSLFENKKNSNVSSPELFTSSNIPGRNSAKNVKSRLKSVSKKSLIFSKSAETCKPDKIEREPSKNLKRTNVVQSKKNTLEAAPKKSMELLKKDKSSEEHKIQKPAAQNISTLKINSKNHFSSKTKQESFPTKKQGLESVSAKSSRLNENCLSKKECPIISKQNPDISKLNLKSKSPVLTKDLKSNSFTYTPELEVSESTLTSVPDTLSPPSKNESEKLSNSHQRNKVLNSNSDSIKLQSLFNVLPDDKSGILLRVPSGTSDSFRCLKCKKLFKRIKAATVHYANCKAVWMKKNMVVLLRNIEWICLQCNFNCHQIGDLTVHKRSCSKSTNNISIDKYIKNYNDICVNWCSKCSYSCISSIRFNQHPCKERLERMSKCYIGVKKLNIIKPSQRLECPYCESTFFTFNAYKKHIQKHQISSESSQHYCIIDEKTFIAQEIKGIIQREPVETPEDVVKNWLKPITNVCATQNTDNYQLYANHNLNVVVPQNVEPLLLQAAEKLLAKEKAPDDDRFGSEFPLEKAKEILENSNLFCTKANNPDLPISDDAFHAYMKDFCCRCEKHENLTEEKPCLSCLNVYINKKGMIFQSDDSINQPCLDENNSKGSGNRIEASASFDVSLLNNGQDVPDSLNHTDAVHENEASPIHSSVSSSTDQIPSSNAVSTTDEYTSRSPAVSNVESEEHPSSSVRVVVIIIADSHDSKYSQEKHNNLIYKLVELKRKGLDPSMPEEQNIPEGYFYKYSDSPSNDLSEIPNSLDSQNTTNNESAAQLTGENLPDHIVKNYIVINRPFVEVMDIFVAEEACDLDVVLCNCSYKFHLSWQFIPEISFTIFCVKDTSEPIECKYICALCFDTIRAQFLIEHLKLIHVDVHESVNLLITNKFSF